MLHLAKTSTSLLLTAAAVILALGCKASEAGSTLQTSLNDTPTMNPKFEARNPRPCPSVRHRPSSAEAAALIQCTEDSVARDNTMLMQNIAVSVSGATQANAYFNEQDSDVSKSVYPINGSMVVYNCATVDNVMNNSGKNCYVSQHLKQTGYCFSNRDGDYRCKMGGGDSGFVHFTDPGPTTY